ncbi:oleate hydratase [Phenylobacterium ferrooxidans]|uniref:Oleate hydratase n=1 Tax=Phenylobacterium ferrooxidans TaxID=2982689 RepID=A0ABW6CQ06_9CAUL
MTPARPAPNRRAYLVGGGIASLAAAAFLVRDGGFRGSDVEIFEEAPILGGSLDGSGTADLGYVVRGGRMFTYEAYTCTLALLDSIPSLQDAAVSLKDGMLAFNTELRSDSHARLVAGGRRLDASDLQLTRRDQLDLAKVMASSEAAMGGKRIEDLFQPKFFETNFWCMWATTFAFQRWHSAIELKRYMHRFVQELPRLHTLGGVRRTRFNQYDSIVLPLQRWLEGLGVRIHHSARVDDLQYRYGRTGRHVDQLLYRVGEAVRVAEVGRDDLVLVTNGSMTAGATFGSMHTPAAATPQDKGGAWTLWETLAESEPGLGRPDVFTRDTAGSRWLSFTVTLRDPAFFELMEAFTGNPAGTGGLVTFKDSSWLMSVVLAHQPHFIDQPDGVFVFWGYGLFVDEVGDFVGKSMAECTGEDILIELLGHLRLQALQGKILASANCIPCMMPYITSQFMLRAPGDRAPVRPPKIHNLAFIGQFCELPQDVVFTVEYSVRSAQTAVYGLLDLDAPIPPIYHGELDPAVLLRSSMTLLRRPQAAK